MMRIIRIQPAKLLSRFFSGSNQVVSGFERDDLNYRLLINWNNGAVSEFPYVFLRDNAPAEHTISENDLLRIRKLGILDLDPDIKPTDVAKGYSSIQLKWPDVDDVVDYPFEWLSIHDLCCDEAKSKRDNSEFLTKKVHWTKEVAEKMCLKPFDYEDCLKDEREMYKALNQLSVYGMFIVEKMNCIDSEIFRWGDYFQGLFPNHYGACFVVRNKAEITNAAYSNEGLGFHTDLTFMQNQPPVQCFHCLSPSDIGGETILVDGFHVADELRKTDPDAYKLLCDTEFEYVDRGRDITEHYVVSKHSIIRLDSDGRMEQISVEDHMRDWRLKCDVSKIRDILKAYKMFVENLYKPKNVLVFKLDAGQMLVIDNYRLLHGRKAFQVSPGYERHLRGAYISWDIVRSKLRVFRKKFGEL